MSEQRFRLQSRDVRAHMEFVDGVLWVHHDGRTFAHDPREAARKGRARAGGGTGRGEIEAPMPGKITKLLKSKGEQVQRGDAVLVMEAMKMEYTLKAEIAGVVAAVSCAVGDQVTLGQTLVKVEAAP